MICLLSSRVEPHSEHFSEYICKTSHISSINTKCSLRYIAPKICVVSQPQNKVPFRNLNVQGDTTSSKCMGPATFLEHNWNGGSPPVPPPEKGPISSPARSIT